MKGKIGKLAYHGVNGLFLVIYNAILSSALRISNSEYHPLHPDHYGPTNKDLKPYILCVTLYLMKGKIGKLAYQGVNGLFLVVYNTILSSALRIRNSKCYPLHPDHYEPTNKDFLPPTSNKW